MTDEREHWRRQRLLEDIAALDGLLAQQQRNLREIETTIARFGMAPPLEWVNQREESLRQIEAKQQELAEKGQGLEELEGRIRELAALPPSPVLEVPPAEPRKEQSAPDRLPFEPEMILIPAGEFLMGSDPEKDKHAWDREQPQHTLYLPDYTIAKTPVTNAQYAEFVRDAGIVNPPEHWRKGELPPDKLDHPVVYVSWHDAVAYCDWLADVTGKPYRLPSEAEWEKAARGTNGRIYPWGNRWYPGWCDTHCNTLEGGVRGTTPVERYPRGASPYGVLDMAGNVREWTRSLWGQEGEEPDFEYPYDPQDGRENPEAGDDVRRVVRGGSWNDGRYGFRCAFREGYIRPDYGHNTLGFRVVVSPYI